MAQDFLTTYKYGWKTSYYQNTYDMKNDGVVDEPTTAEDIIKQLEEIDEDCESCKI